MSSGKSPFTIVPIPSINKTQPDELPVKVCTCTRFVYIINRRERVRWGGREEREGERERERES